MLRLEQTVAFCHHRLITTGLHQNHMTYRALRRAFATEFQRHGSPKDAQAQLRHSKLEMTGWYMREIPESVRAAVVEMDAEICQGVESNSAAPDSGRPQ